MKISDITVYTVKPRWIFLKITTDNGLEGWGEMVSGTKTETVVAGAKEMAKRIMGRMALWDIKGKFYNAPVYELLGGSARDKIKVYSWIGGDRPSDVVKDAQDRVDRGFDSIKMNATEELHYIDNFKKVDEVVERVAALRETFGNKLNIGIDFHGRVHKPMAKVLAKELEKYDRKSGSFQRCCRTRCNSSGYR